MDGQFAMNNAGFILIYFIFGMLLLAIGCYGFAGDYMRFRSRLAAPVSIFLALIGVVCIFLAVLALGGIRYF